jgi:hypothetical protein
MKIKDIIFLALFYIRVPEIYRYFRRIISGNQIPILRYHRVTPQNEKWSIPATDLNIFEKQIKWLSKNFNLRIPCGLPQGHSLKKFKKIPNNLKNNYIINLQNICEIIVPPGLGKKMILSWDAIREMKDNGITFGVHTAT